MRARTSVLPALLVAAGCLSCVAGCGSRTRPEGEVSGRVRVNGNPVTAGIVKFFPEDGGTPVGTALRADGTYRATGVPAGRSRVAIETLAFARLTPPPPALDKQLGGPRLRYVPIPPRYERPDTSGLSLEVRRGRASFDIDLQ